MASITLTGKQADVHTSNGTFIFVLPDQADLLTQVENDLDRFEKCAHDHGRFAMIHFFGWELPPEPEKE